MRPHTFKGVATDQFIGKTMAGFSHASDSRPDKAFKTIYEMGLFHSWAVIWCPVKELPGDYMRAAHTQPARSSAPVSP